MKLGRIFRQVMFWTVPIVATILVIVTGFVYWLVATPTGTRWLIHTAASQFDGETQGVRGSLWHGFELEHIHLKLPNQLTVELDSAAVKVDWPRVWHHRELRIEHLTAEKVAVWMDGVPVDEPPSTEPFTMPDLPVTVRLDELYVGSVFFSQHGEVLPVDLSQLQLRASANLTQEKAHIELHQAHAGYEDMQLDLHGQAELAPVAAPWHSQAQLQATVHSDQASSQICVNQYLPAHWQTTAKPTTAQKSADSTVPEANSTSVPADCRVEVSAQWNGSLEQGQLSLQGAGQGLHLQAQSDLELDHAFPLRDTFIDLVLPDESGVQARLDWSHSAEQPNTEHVKGTIHVNRFDVGAWIPNQGLPAVLSFDSSYDVVLSQGGKQLDAAKINLTIKPGSRWNNEDVAGHVIADVGRLELENQPVLWQAYYVENSDIDLKLGANSVLLKGAFGLKEHALKVNVDLPDMAQIWPDLKTIGPTKLDAELKGTLHEHALEAKLLHVLEGEKAKEGELGVGPVEAALALTGIWDMNTQTPSWRGQIQPLKLDHAGLHVQVADRIPINVQLPAAEQQLNVEVGAFTLRSEIDNYALLQLQHQKTQWSPAGFQTQGRAPDVILSEERVQRVMKLLNLEEPESAHGGVIDKRKQKVAKGQDLHLQLDWNVGLKEALQGRIQLKRLAGDILVPADPPFLLGLTKTEALITLTPQGGAGRSVIQAELDVQTQDKGYIKATGNTPIYYTAAQGIHVRDADRKELVLNAHMDDLAWTSLFLQDKLVLGGALDANLRIQSTPNGSFTSSGTMQGKNLKVVRLDDGVRLLDGTLKASLNNNRFELERLYFPAVLRVEPKEWRTATWIKENPDAKGGGVTVSGYWELDQNRGDFDVKLYRYPILQRADRYAMVTGDIHLNAALPHITLSGKITADAGWFNLDMLGGIPTVDSDVIVVRSTDPVKEEDENSAPLDMTMNLEVDLGPRFYLTGYGVNSGLVGSMQIQMLNDQLTALGALNTRGGAIEVYGQRLQLRRGTVTFQGDIANPILDIQALRTGLSVQAGVKVGGTARRPKIDLISVPDVSELEKLSWLLFGHGPDDGGDIALLFSVGTSFLGGGEPFYRRFGIDELSMRSGELGGAGSILPATSVASSPENEISAVERRFIEASKTLSNGVKLSVRQALADTGTVGRVSYRLSRRLTAEVSVGTISGLALVYRWFSRDDPE